MLQALAGVGSPPAIVLGLVALAAVVLVGRLLLNVAWKLVTVALAVTTVLWMAGVQFG